MNPLASTVENAPGALPVRRTHADSRTNRPAQPLLVRRLHVDLMRLRAAACRLTGH